MGTNFVRTGQVPAGRVLGWRQAPGSRLGLAQFPPQTAACPEEQKVFALWESGDTSDQVR